MRYFTVPVMSTILLTIGLLLSGCGSIRKPYLDRAMYAVNVELPGNTKPGEGRGVVKIARIYVAAPYDDRTFVYKTGPNEFKVDYYNTFFTSPDRMLTALLERYMQAAGGFDTVLSSMSGADSNFRLEGAINSLYADYTEDALPVAVVEARFMLVGIRDADDSVLHTKTYIQKVQAETPDPDGVIDAWGEALTTIYAELAEDLIKAVPPGSSEPKTESVETEQEATPVQDQ